MEHSAVELSLVLLKICIVKDFSEKQKKIKSKINASPQRPPRTPRMSFCWGIGNLGWIESRGKIIFSGSQVMAAILSGLVYSS